MSKVIGFIRQIYWPYPIREAVVFNETIGNEDTDVAVLEERDRSEVVLDIVARVIGLILTLYGTVEIAGIPLTDWIAGVCQ